MKPKPNKKSVLKYHVGQKFYIVDTTGQPTTLSIKVVLEVDKRKSESYLIFDIALLNPPNVSRAAVRLCAKRVSERFIDRVASASCCERTFGLHCVRIHSVTLRQIWLAYYKKRKANTRRRLWEYMKPKLWLPGVKHSTQDAFPRKQQAIVEECEAAIRELNGKGRK